MAKGGSTTSTVAVPEYIEEAAKRNLNKAERISQIGPMPYYGADVAALTPMQEAAAQNIADTASVFGTAGGNMSQQDIRGGMPEPTTFAGGVRGYSSAPMYEQSLEAFDEARPGQKEYIESFFIDPYTGRAGSNVQAPIDYTSLTPGGSGDLGGINRGQTGGVGVGGGDGGGGETYFPPVFTPPVFTPPVVTPPPITTDFIDLNDNVAPYMDVDKFDLAGSNNFLTQEELANKLKVIQTVIGDPTYNPNTDVLTADQQALVQSQTTALDGDVNTNDYADRADIAMGDIYNNNQQIYGTDTGNNITSLATGGVTKTRSELAGLAGSTVNADGTYNNPIWDGGGPIFTGGGADNQGNLGQVGDFFGSIGDKLGITDFSGQGGGLLSGLNLTGPVTPKSASELQFEADRAPGGVHYEGGGADKRAQAEANANAKLADAAAKQSLIDNNISVVLPAEKTISSSKLKDTLEAGYKPQVIDGKNYLVSGPGGTAIPIDNAAVRRAETKYGLTFAENKPSPTTGFTQAQVLNGGKTGNFNFVPFA